MVAQIINTMSHCRFETYLYAAGHDRDRALNLYLWNATIGGAFHLPIQAVEVALRNRINFALVSEFGANWWETERFLTKIDHERTRDLNTVFARLKRKDADLDTNQIVASLSFGFWVGMLQARYNPPIWGAHFRAAFPQVPATETRNTLFRIAGRIAQFRNRISHHEPLLKENISLLYGDIMQLLNWLCPDTAAWIRPVCEVPKIMRTKP